ncbi:hypothetical protein NOF55_13335 [Rhizobiaceae bacterium BDR2-2]|uniref:Uncharacterized protein n=1 Tax=Ectorhizobium quercum TaxID=2965071 RepID=A0AAE3MZC5_9HYPH|nr:hypothetical protein [Ectorhizobium quercum]MCX8998088.1 hypothetical protein [Ectorhizobium quercum]
MGAFQNKAVKLLQVQDGHESVSELALANARLLKAFLDFYLSTGGTLDEVVEAAQSAETERQAGAQRVDVAMGDVMTALAVLGHVHDIDIMQAGYNTLEAQIRELKASLNSLRADDF